MNLAKNLQYLRKRDKVTQEELADRLGVSRQSVSKWETGEAYPETDKLIMLCDLFNVSLDGLLRGDVTGDISENKDDGTEFARLIDRFSKAISLGVFLILFGVAALLAFLGAGEYLEKPASDLTAVSGVAALLILVAVAVFLFVLRGMEFDSYKKAHPEVKPWCGEAESKSFLKKFNVAMAGLVAGILADVVFLVIFASLIDAKVITSSNEDGLYCIIVAIFMAALAFIVGGLCYFGMQHSKYDVTEYNKQNRIDASPRNKLKDGLCAAVMLICTAIFLVAGFVFELWHPAWAVFPVGGIICAVISVLIGTKED